MNIELSPQELAYIISLMKPELRSADLWLDWEEGGQYTDEQIEEIRAEIGKFKALLRRLEEALEKGQ